MRIIAIDLSCFNKVDFLASFGGVTTAGGTMMGGHLQGGPDGSRGPYGRLQGSKGPKQSWLDPNFSTNSDLSCTSVMVRKNLDFRRRLYPPNPYFFFHMRI